MNLLSIKEAMGSDWRPSAVFGADKGRELRKWMNFCGIKSEYCHEYTHVYCKSIVLIL